jgi:CRISPR-associated protein Cmr5
MLRSLDQDRAKFAWEKIREVKTKYKESEDAYNSYVKKSPTLILTNGLGNTLAFFYSKFGSRPKLSPDERAYKLLYDHLNEWCKNQKIVTDDILKWTVRDASSLDVFRITNEVMAILSWLKRFAEAELNEEGKEI